jgi:hypothetical protein
MNTNMENTANDAVLQEQVTEQDVMETTEPQVEDQSSVTEEPKSELENLIELRTGLFEVSLDVEDLKWLKNSCNSKFGFKGPNEAFMLINAYLGLDAAIQNISQNKEAKSVKLSAATIEALAVLVNRYEGTGVAIAQRVFKVAVSLQQVIGIMRELDTEINAIEAAMKAEEKPETAAE